MGVPQNAFGDPSINNSGRYIGFSTTDAAGQVTARLYDAGSGATTAVSRDFASGSPSTGSFSQVSGDGRWVAFVSSATNIVPGATGVPTVYRYDTNIGTTDTVARNLQGVMPTGGLAGMPYIDRDASTGVFPSTMRNLSAGADTRLERVYAWRLP